jgi:UPF0755 protein
LAKRSTSILSTLLFLGLIGAGIAFYFYNRIFSVNVETSNNNESVFIPSGASLNEVANLLENNDQIKDRKSFLWTAEKMNYKDQLIKGGKYEIQSGWSNRDLVRHLRSGNQTPVKITFNNVRFLHELAPKIAEQLELNEADFLKVLADTANISAMGYTPETFISMFIPNTYEMYWNTDAKSFIERMEKEHKKFWSKNDRVRKAREKGMSPLEAYTLASIVEKETQKNDEKPRLAGVYVNRLKRGIPLQADPTVVFANGDFGIRRVLYKHLEKESPYNTYINKGLPPGPIYMPNIQSIDAVLNCEDHQYIYFCARTDGSGYHDYAKTLAEHNRNASKFHDYLNKRKIKN